MTAATGAAAPSSAQLSPPNAIALAPTVLWRLDKRRAEPEVAVGGAERDAPTHQDVGGEHDHKAPSTGRSRRRWPPTELVKPPAPRANRSTTTSGEPRMRSSLAAGCVDRESVRVSRHGAARRALRRCCGPPDGTLAQHQRAWRPTRRRAVAVPTREREQHERRREAGNQPDESAGDEVHRDVERWPHDAEIEVARDDEVLREVAPLQVRMPGGRRRRDHQAIIEPSRGPTSEIELTACCNGVSNWRTRTAPDEGDGPPVRGGAARRLTSTPSDRQTSRSAPRRMSRIHHASRARPRRGASAEERHSGVPAASASRPIWRTRPSRSPTIPPLRRPRSRTGAECAGEVRQAPDQRDGTTRGRRWRVIAEARQHLVEHPPALRGAPSAAPRQRCSPKAERDMWPGDMTTDVEATAVGPKTASSPVRRGDSSTASHRRRGPCRRASTSTHDRAPERLDRRIQPGTLRTARRDAPARLAKRARWSGCSGVREAARYEVPGRLVAGDEERQHIGNGFALLSACPPTRNDEHTHKIVAWRGATVSYVRNQEVVQLEQVVDSHDRGVGRFIVASNQRRKSVSSAFAMPSSSAMTSTGKRGPRSPRRDRSLARGTASRRGEPTAALDLARRPRAVWKRPPTSARHRPWAGGSMCRMTLDRSPWRSGSFTSTPELETERLQGRD